MLKLNGLKGISNDEFLEKKHNIWIGISLSNRFFDNKNIKLLIDFALKYTKNKVLIWVPGRIQATNYKYFDNLTRAEALRKAFEDEDRVNSEVKSMLQLYSNEIRNRVVIANYDDICTPKHIKQREIFFRLFAKQGEFYNSIMEIVKELISIRGRTYDKARAESIALYIIHELPLFVDGVQKNDDSTIYTLIPYPGFGKLDDLVMDIRHGGKYPDLKEQLIFDNQIGIIDVSINIC